MKIWKNTPTLDGLIDDWPVTTSKEEATVALLGSKPIILSEFPHLKGIFRAGVGKDNVPEEEAKKRGIKIGFPSRKTVEFIYEETANFTCYLVLKMLFQEVGTLNPWIKFQRESLQEKILLVVGVGNIGKRVANKMKDFMVVKTFDIVDNTEDALNEMLRTADCVSLHIPNLPENKNFINKGRLGLMKDHAILINTARGAIVSESDLYEEIKNDRLKAAFDVFWEEPYNGKLKEFHPERFFMTPHVASTCNAFLKGTAEDFRKFITEEIDNV